MGEDHEHRDDAQQLDAGIPLPPPICDSGMRRCAVSGVSAVVVLRGLVLLAHNSPLVCGLPPESYMSRPTGIFYEKIKSNKCLSVWYAVVED